MTEIGEQPDQSIQQPNHKMFNGLEYVNDASDHLSTLDVPEFVALTVLNIVDHPDQVKIYLTRSIRSMVIELDLHPSDRGKVIGRGGRTIIALRSLLRAMLGANMMEYKISVIEDD